jgi:hypothetical protein
LTAAPERIENLEMISGVGIATYPAKLEFTVVAGHVVATLTLFYISFTKRADTNFLIFHPFFKLNV